MACMLEQDTNAVIMPVCNAGLCACLYIYTLLYSKVNFLLSHYFFYLSIQISLRGKMTGFSSHTVMSGKRSCWENGHWGIWVYPVKDSIDNNFTFLCVIASNSLVFLHSCYSTTFDPILLR